MPWSVCLSKLLPEENHKIQILTFLVFTLFSIQQFFQPIFIQNRNAEFPGFIEFGTRLFTGHHIIRFFTDTGSDASSCLADEFTSLFPGQARQASRQDKAFSGEDV